MGVKHTVLPDGLSPTVAFTVLAQLCGPTANETEMGATPLFTKNGEGRNFDFFDVVESCQIQQQCMFLALYFLGLLHYNSYKILSALSLF